MLKFNFTVSMTIISFVFYRFRGFLAQHFLEAFEGLELFTL
jgi:hypothetical protein